MGRVHDEPLRIVVDLEFDSVGAAESFRERLRGLWRQVEGRVIGAPAATLIEVLDAAEC